MHGQVFVMSNVYFEETISDNSGPIATKRNLSNNTLIHVNHFKYNDKRKQKIQKSEELIMSRKLHNIKVYPVYVSP